MFCGVWLHFVVGVVFAEDAKVVGVVDVDLDQADEVERLQIKAQIISRISLPCLILLEIGCDDVEDAEASTIGKRFVIEAMPPDLPIDCCCESDGSRDCYIHAQHTNGRNKQN